jgi:tetratricopeptide (TPR) repeat protein
MNKQASILFNISSSISDTWLALQEAAAPQSYYQRLIYALLSRRLSTTEGFQALGRQFAEIARHAYFARQMDAVEQASLVMLALPISKELKAVALYYQAICTWRRGHADEARHTLERVIEEAPPDYRARALLTMGTTYCGQDQVEAALAFYLAAGRAAGEHDLLTFAESQKMIAVVRSIHGDHRQALDDLEQLFPLVRAIGKHHPAIYYGFLNSLAVELGEVGRLDEANAACAIALASPFSAIYPEIVQTRDEIAAKRTTATPSIVAVSITPEPVPVRLVRPAQQAKPVCALAFLWLANKKSVLQTSIAIAPAIPLIESFQTILNRVRFCIQPRSPPHGF